ncbi:ABC transporter ATP-binding protein [Campylobacter concisus]|uniref:ATP-binding cassette domain-containing protein n=1 Tax=Campylobacter concisus TaxID=199 RepID=UPI0021565769|nr:ABC transporter ATP-binding protein [Campylobacter concisus]
MRENLIEVLIAGKSVRDYGKKGLVSLVAYVPQTHAPYTRVSGGERQLAYIARTLVQGAKVIFMDEPTNGLDFGNQIRLLEMIKALGDEGYTFVQTTYYPRHAKFVSSLTLFIKDGEILAFGRSEQLINAENIDKIYGINYEKYEDRL